MTVFCTIYDNASSKNLSMEIWYTFVFHPHHLICLDTHTISVKAVLDFPEMAKNDDVACYSIGHLHKVDIAGLHLCKQKLNSTNITDYILIKYII